MTFDLAQMIADREAGTPGEWFYDDSRYYETVVTDVAGEEVRALSEPGDAAIDARRIARVPAMEAEIIRLTARAEWLEGALAGCVAAIEHADMSDGVCCCGDNMEGHSGPMGCGHSPTDMGEYHAHQVLSASRVVLFPRTDAALSTHTEEPKT